MVKFTKSLTVIALAVVALTIIVAVCLRLFLPTTSTLPANTTKEMPRQELFDKYFSSLKLTTESFTSQEKPQLEWRLKTEAPVTTQIVFKVLDTAKGIFISETTPIALRDFQGSYFGNPGKAGQYELWVYLIETDNIQALVAVLPFTVK
jgi:hypothetical protein